MQEILLLKWLCPALVEPNYSKCLKMSWDTVFQVGIQIAIIHLLDITLEDCLKITMVPPFTNLICSMIVHVHGGNMVVMFITWCRPWEQKQNFAKWFFVSQIFLKQVFMNQSINCITVAVGNTLNSPKLSKGKPKDNWGSVSSARSLDMGHTSIPVHFLGPARNVRQPVCLTSGPGGLTVPASREGLGQPKYSLSALKRLKGACNAPVHGYCHLLWGALSNTGCSEWASSITLFSFDFFFWKTLF